MLGYSTIAHVGFILAAVLCGTPTGHAAALYYTLTYVIMAAGSFARVILLRRKGYQSENLSDFKGLNARSPWFAGIMLFFMFGLAGEAGRASSRGRGCQHVQIQAGAV